MTIIDKESTLKAFDVVGITGGQPITATQAGYTIIPEHPVHPAAFVLTFDTNWVIPDKYQISALLVLEYTFRNNNKPPKIEELFDIIQQAVIETNELIAKECKNRELDVHKLEIMPIDNIQTHSTLQYCLTRAYSVN